MKKILVFLLSLSCLFGFSNNGHEKKQYADNSIIIGETKIVVTGGHSTDEVLKAKVLIENKNDYFILLNPAKSYYFINGKSAKESKISRSLVDSLNT